MSSSQVGRLTDDFFRHEAGKVVSLLVKSLGVEHLQLAEDVVQEALARALKTWPFYGVPENPGGWIAQTAKNLAIDAVRREQLVKRKQIDIFGSLHRWSGPVAEDDLTEFGREVDDAVLRLMFVCCHPTVPKNSQHVLALKTLCGFGVGEIAAALFTTEAAIQKRLTRARERLVEGEVSAELPIGESLDQRLEGVLKTLYLLFNGGYKAHTGTQLVREDLCAEAIRLTSLLASMPVGDRPRTHALLSLMFCNAARLKGRVDSRGNLLLLADQDRTLWNAELIQKGLDHLGKSAQGDSLDSLHLQAAISAVHCTAKDFASTDWRQILQLYDLLLVVEPSPVSGLNRAIAVGQVEGPAAGIDALRATRSHSLDRYYLYHAALAHFEDQLDNATAAAGHLRAALELAEADSERALLTERLQRMELSEKI